MAQEAVPGSRRSDGLNPQPRIGEWVLGASVFPANDESPDHLRYLQATDKVPATVTYARRDTA